MAATLPKSPAQKPATPAEISQNWSDSHGITYVGEDVEISVSVAVKLSRNYQSAGIEAGIKFKTKANRADEAIPAASKKVRDAIQKEIQILSGVMDNLP
jgi:hypothetical protein